MLADLLTLGSRWTLVGGKGGVGKTTTAAALAISLADRGDRALVLSVDPAHSLGDALGTPLGPEERAVTGVPGLHALEVDAEAERRRFMDARRGTLLQLVERGTYLARADVEEMVDLAVPGVDELAALFRLMELAGDGSRKLVIDTAPTGHTLRLLDLPGIARGWLAALQAMERKHRIVADALTRGGYAGDEATALLADLDAELDRLSALLRDPRQTRFVLVTTPEPVVLAEADRYHRALTERGVALAGIVVNRSGPRVPPDATGAGMAYVPPLDPDPRGPDGLRRFAAAAAAEPSLARDPAGRAPTSLVPGRSYLPPADRRLYLVGGKGGVGKSTAAAAIAVHLAERGSGRVLLLGLDPAGSLGEVLGTEVGPEPGAVPGVPGLVARQLDAPAVWRRFRDEYREEAERLFSGILSGGISAAGDREVVERLIDLAPPGVDELVGLLEVVDLTGDRAYDALVVDAAPTGHLVRLLELPGVALDWTSAILRLLLKYREVVGLGELAERVLKLSRGLRSLRELLGDAGRTWLLVVALPESLSVPETERLLRRLPELGISPSALLLNRLPRSASGPIAAAAAELGALGREAGTPVVAAPDLEEGPEGPEDLRRFLGHWREIELDGGERTNDA